MSKRAHWGSRFAFLLAAAGSAVGLGNIWKFPYITGVNGGGAFVLIYLLCVALVGVPVLVAELYIGQKSQKNAVEAFSVLDPPRSPWRISGLLGVLSAFLILSFYSVIGGWVIDFLFQSLMGKISSLPEEALKGLLGGLFSAPLWQILWHTVFMGLTVGIVFMGVNEGLERWSKILMPSLFVLLFILLVYCWKLEGFPKAVDFLFSTRADKLTFSGILEAMGHAFFTLSLGMGAMITYGSYLGQRENLVRISFLLALLDTLVALVAGLVIFSITFTFNMEPAAGPGLIFSTLPVLFSKMSAGGVLAVAFFLLVLFAALTSSVSILEVCVAYWSETHGLNRKKATILTAGAIYLLGFLTVFSTNRLSNFKILGLTFFDLFDKLTSSYLLPIGGFITILFMGWKLGHQSVKDLFPSSSLMQKATLFLFRFITPAVMVILIYHFAT
ncbi:MAG: sodium-dependent transporter [Bdellovibrio sp.]|nr:MAG: sodium-dependent transporter [Bdellovibrio sp.]